MNLEWQAALDAVIEHPLFAFGLTLGVYQLALFLYEKTRWMIFQPVLVSMVILIATLLVLDIDYADYKQGAQLLDRKSTRLNSSHVRISYAVFCLKKKKKKNKST